MTRRRITPEMIAALSAVLIGVSALFVSIYQASIMREQQRIMFEQQRASVWPYLQVGTNHGDEGVEVVVTNQGVGPARIRSVETTLDGAVVKNWGEVFSALLGNPRVPYNRRSINRRVLPPEASVRILGINRAVAESIGRNFNNLDMMLCYCSVYDECWKTKWRGFGVEPVDTCELDEARQFEN